MAGEIISLLLGEPAKDLPDELKDWASKNHINLSKSIVNDALRATLSVRKNSELKVLWKESNEYQSWIEEVKNLERLFQRVVLFWLSTTHPCQIYTIMINGCYNVELFDT
ncbi:DUF4259 domain-containing protein [Paenibacillus hexagrammi]|uniref:DUF4259 domain-containing protein n=1 Tax=Paenibacillus hexagrammi TaxID=2908839 RepID=A0ABY3SRL7_9BACL|nr:DUF4259 domain-containing protein [Paenibacillus sp. YPD9-1]UJF35904.1 DUF4259 domain-containing protein [Paenibacillus sp. YPD9-1]